MKIKIHWKLTIIFCFIIILAISAGYLYQVNHLKSYVENNVRNNIKHQLAISKDFLEVSLKDKTIPEDFQSIAKKIGESLGLRATIITLDGRVLSDTDLNKEQLLAVENHANRPEVKDALAKGFGVSERFSYTIKKDMLYMAVPFSKGNDKSVLRLSVPLHDIELLEARMRRVLGVSVIGILLLSLGLTFLVSVLYRGRLAKCPPLPRLWRRETFQKKFQFIRRMRLANLRSL